MNVQSRFEISAAGRRVPWEGDPSSPLWFIGEAPGAVEDKLLRPFAGPAGQYFDMGLRDSAIIRGDCFVWKE